METKKMTIKVVDIPWTPKTFHFEQDKQWLDENLELYGYEAVVISGLVVEATAYRFADSVNLDVSASCHLKATCARCLKEFDYVLSDRFRVVSKPESMGGFGDEQDEDFASAPMVNGEVDVEPFVAEFLKLQIPMRFLCSEECKGLCAVCGEDKNLGPCRCEREDMRK